MKASHYDVVVVGAGPSGSLCARNLARAGYSVLLCEKRPVVGVPVRCGEATGTRARLSQLITVNEDAIETTVTGAIVNGTGGVRVRYDARREVGVMLDRRVFDRDIADQAVREGAELQVNARVFEVSPPSGGIRKIRVERNGNVFDVTAAMVVGADGAESLTGRMAGLKTRQLPPSSCTAIELRIKAMDANPNHLTFWHGHDDTNKGYVWVFPKVKSGVVNLGVGEQTPKLGAKTMLELCMEYKQRLFPDAEIEEIHGGCVPLSGNLPEYTADRFLLCGDAAHHTNPLTGGGIMSGLAGGDAAANWIDKGFKAGNLSAGFLKQYEAECWDRFGRRHRNHARVRDFLFGLDARNQAVFYRVFKQLVEKRRSRFQRILAFSRYGLLIARNFRLAWKAVRGAA